MKSMTENEIDDYSAKTKSMATEAAKSFHNRYQDMGVCCLG